ncbi:UNVERIFIED_CONTAM: hypothetical protein K2H54_005413 [Gekko kuhli]
MADLSPAWVTGWKAAATTPEGLLDLVLDDAYAYLDGLERRKGSLLDAPTLLSLSGLGGRPGGSRGRREAGPVRLSLDLAGFSPEDVAVRLDGRKLQVTAKKESQRRAPDGCCARDAREVYREVLLPDDADLEALACALNPDGQLRIEAPRLPPPPPPERVVPIQRMETAVGEGKPGRSAAGGEEKKPDGKKLLEQLLSDMQGHLDEMERLRAALLDAYPLFGARPQHARLGKAARDEEEEEGGGPYRYSLDVAGFAPEEVSVQLQGRRLTVRAKHDRRSEAADGCVSHEYREVRKEVVLPGDADLEAVACALDGGRLCVEAPRLALLDAEPRTIPVAVATAPASPGPERRAPPPPQQPDAPQEEDEAAAAAAADDP